MADDKLGENFTRLALVNGDREMVNKLKIFHRKNLFPSICKLKERGASTFEGLHPFSDFMCLQQPNIFCSIGKYVYCWDYN